jgi:hypothetical protein
LSRKRPSRNDPCICGSGLKFKKCCGAFNNYDPGIIDPFYKYSQLLTSLKIKLDNYFKKEIRKNKRGFQQQFLRFSTREKLPQEHESFFSDWLWFDQPVMDNQTLGHIYYRNHSAFMEKNLANALAAMNDSFLSVYAVKESHNLSLVVTDLFLGTEHRILIKEPLDLEEAVKDIILLGRIVPFSSDQVFSGMVLMCKDKDGQSEFLKKHISYLDDILHLSTRETLKSQAHILYGLFSHAIEKVLLDLSDIRIIELNKNSLELLLRLINNHPEYTYIHRTEGFQWYKYNQAAPGYSRIAVGQECALASSCDIDSLNCSMGLFSSVTPYSQIRLLNSAFAMEPPAMDLTHLWFLVIKDKETERWLSTPHQELKGKTPIALLEQGEKNEIIRLLDEFAQDTRSEEEIELLDYMRKRVIDYPIPNSQ